MWIGDVWNVVGDVYRCADRRDRDTSLVSASQAAADSFRHGGIGIRCCAAGITRSPNRAAKRDRLICGRGRNRALNLAEH